MGFPLVANRVCGACNVCCSLPAIIDPKLRKLPGVLCTHWAGGCSIYQRRPKTCVGHHCGWRHLDHLDESWRPDLSKIYIELKSDPPEHFRHELPNAPFCFRFTLLDDVPPEHLERLASTVAGLIENDVPVILAVAAPPEHMSCHILLNSKLKPHVAPRGAAFNEGFARAIMAILQMPPEKVVLT